MVFPVYPPTDFFSFGTIMAELIGRPGLGLAPEVNLHCYRLLAEDDGDLSSYGIWSLLNALAHIEHNRWR